MRKLAFLFCLILSFTYPPGALAKSDASSLGEEQASEKLDLEQMKQELNELKSNINEGLEGIKKVDTNALKNLQEFHLICQPAKCEIAPGKVIECLTYNGILPGPIIRVKEGQLVRLIVHNQSSSATSMDIHGLVLPDSVNGFPNSKSGLVIPGETYAYQFVAKPAGTYWYHPQIVHGDQKVKGLYGALIIEPADPPVKTFDQDVLLMLSDIAVTKTDNQPSTHSSTTKSAAEPHTSTRGASLFARSPVEHKFAGQVATADNSPTTTANFTACSPVSHQAHSTFYLINGKTAPAIPPIEVRENTRVRLRIINCGQHPVPLHMTGHKFQLISLNGSAMGEQIVHDTVTLGVSNRLDIEFTANNPGIWTLGSELIEQSTSDGQFPGGMVCLLKYTNQ